MNNTQHFTRIFTIFLFLILVGSSAAMAQKIKGTIKGTVNDGANQSIENVSVSLKNTHLGTTTDNDGDFVLLAPAGNYTLVISMMGYQKKEMPIVVKAGQITEVDDVVLMPLSGSLAEVKVKGSKTNKFRSKKSNDVAKMPLDNLENPQVYNSITSSLLTEQQDLSVDVALKNVPGLQTMWNATGRSGDGGSYFNSRGFILQSTLRNGMAGAVSNTNDAVNVDKIEVLKGPSATLFGSTLTSFGGVINRVTKTPYDEFGGQLSYTAGSYGLNRFTADLNTPLDSGKKLLFRLNTALNYQNSFQTSGYSQGAVIDPSLLWKVNGRLTVSFDAELNYSKGTEQPIFFFFGNVGALGTDRADGLDINYRQSYASSSLAQNSHNDNYYARVTYKISDQWTSQTNFSATNSFSNGFGPYYYLVAKDSILREDQSTKNSTVGTIEVQQNFNGDFKIGKMRNRFVGGLDYLHQNSHQYFFGGYFDKVATTLPSGAYSNFNYANMQSIYDNGGIAFTYPDIFRTNTYSAYAADVLNVTDRLLVLASLRLDHYANLGSTVGGVTNPGFNQTTASPKFGLVYQLVQKQVSLFANYQNGFVNPGSYIAYDAAAGKPFSKIANVQNAAQIEGGVKLDLFGGKLTSTLSYYNIQLTNVLRSDPAGAAFYAQLQDGTQLSKGFEAEVIANPVEGLNIIGGFSYNDSHYTKSDADVLGRRPATAASPYTANFYASYRLPKTLLSGLGFGFGGNYASDNKVVNSASQGVFILPAYTILNGSVFYEKSKYRINLGVNNFTNKEYWTGYSTVNPQMPRQVLATVSYKF